MLGQIDREFAGQVRLVYKDFPLDFHAGARPAAVAARCAGEKGLYWPYHDLLFEDRPDFSRERLIVYAGRLGLDRAAFAECLDRGRHLAAVEEDLREGRNAGVRGTPTFFINGRRLVGAQPIEVFREAVRDALNAAHER